MQDKNKVKENVSDFDFSSISDDLSIDEMIEMLQKWKAEGATHVCVSGDGDGYVYAESYYERDETDEEYEKMERLILSYKSSSNYISAIPDMPDIVIKYHRADQEFLDIFKHMTSHFKKPEQDDRL